MTFFETAAQGGVFLLLLYAGFASALLYDGCAFLRRRLPRPLAALCDPLWCVFTALACLAALFLGNESHLRLYACLGLVCGGGIYALGIRRIFLAMWRIIKKRRKKTA